MLKLLATAGLIAGMLFASGCGDDDEIPDGGADPTLATSSSPIVPGSDSTATTPSTPPAAGGPCEPNAPGIPELAGETVTTASGLCYLDEVVGTGAAPTPASMVTVHYTGWLTDGTKFDSSRDRGQPTSFALTGVIPGWTEGVGSMNIGGKRRLIVPGELGYGARGNPRAGIAPNATLIFDVELISVQ